MPPQTLSRKDLYELIWSKPMTKLARLYGLSGVGLAKICKKYDIPKPYPGYWAKRRVGQNPKKLKLPEPEREEQIILVEISEAERAATETAEMKAKVAADRGPPIVIPETLRGEHRLVSEAREQFQGAKTNDAGLLIVPDKVSLQIVVSKASLRRALLIMDALLKYCEQRGYVVHAGPQVQINIQYLEFHISEQLEVVREEINEVDLEGRYEFHHNRFREHRRPTGRVTLHLDDGGAYWTSNARHTWRETEKQRLEDRLPAFMAGLITLSARKQAHAEEQEHRRCAAVEAERIRQEEAQRRAGRRKLQKSEQTRLESLLANAEN